MGKYVDEGVRRRFQTGQGGRQVAGVAGASAKNPHVFSQSYGPNGITHSIDMASPSNACGGSHVANFRPWRRRRGNHYTPRPCSPRLYSFARPIQSIHPQAPPVTTLGQPYPNAPHMSHTLRSTRRHPGLARDTDTSRNHSPFCCRRADTKAGCQPGSCPSKSCVVVVIIQIKRVAYIIVATLRGRLLLPCPIRTVPARLQIDSLS